MTAELLNQLTDAIAENVVAKVAPKLIDRLNEHRTSHDCNPALTVGEIAKRLKMSNTTVRQLVRSGALKRIPTLTEIRVRLSVVDALGMPAKGKK